jgi:hypothetical protein
MALRWYNIKELRREDAIGLRRHKSDREGRLIAGG